jgi:hypothetical protein
VSNYNYELQSDVLEHCAACTDERRHLVQTSWSDVHETGSTPGVPEYLFANATVEVAKHIQGDSMASLPRILGFGGH